MLQSIEASIDQLELTSMVTIWLLRLEEAREKKRIDENHKRLPGFFSYWRLSEEEDENA